MTTTSYQVPLTTTFTPPASCFTSLWYNTRLSQTFEVLGDRAASLAPECFPSRYQSRSEFYYSPGICPSGYQTASTTVTSSGTHTETQALCCPLSLSIALPVTGRVSCSSHYDLRDDATTEVNIANPQATDETWNDAWLYANAIQVRYQATDFPTATPAAVTGSTGHEALSTGAKAGIGIGATIAALLVIAIAVGGLLLRRKRHTSSHVPDGYGEHEKSNRLNYT